MLQIAGIQPLSTVDWPGQLALTVFCQGCPWACVYCHNHQILDCRTPGQVSWSEVLSLLERRRGLLDGVVFSGGEATRQGPVLIDAMRQVRALGFKVGLHTAGAYPRTLSQILEGNLVDWVGLDIKAPMENYGQVVFPEGISASPGMKAWNSLDLVLAQPDLSYEVRFTIFPQMSFDPVEVVQACLDKHVKSLVIQTARADGAPLEIQEKFVAWQIEAQEIKAAISALGNKNVVFR